ncbi:MAG: type Z 30S ribosomal protein S14 [Candidatus Shapirobacteria bacterium]|jgi:small subunit ribosomal protein S14
MATEAKIAREHKKLKYKVQYHNRCQLCGRPRAYIRLVGLCRLCFRRLANQGVLPGIKRSSW